MSLPGVSSKACSASSGSRPAYAVDVMRLDIHLELDWKRESQSCSLVLTGMIITGRDLVTKDAWHPPKATMLRPRTCSNGIVFYGEDAAAHSRSSAFNNSATRPFYSPRGLG